MRFQFVVVLFAVVGLSSQKSTPQDDHYVAAVVEYLVVFDALENANIENYKKLIREAAEQDADLIVFPELTLTNGTISVPINGLLQDFPVPAQHPDLYDSLLVVLSAAALTNGIYVVINTREILECTQPQQGEECPEKMEYVFNTNIVFDRTGAVIDRYRKINLFGEINHTPALKPDLGIFTTDFGVTFGHFIGFDLMFQIPAVQIVQKYKMKNIIYSTMEYQEMPYRTAIQLQESYAYTMDVNFLGASGNYDLIGAAGSGIYSGKAGALVSTMPSSETKLLVTRVPKEPGNIQENYPGPIYESPVLQNFRRLYEDTSLTAHVTRPLVRGYQDFTIVDKDVSCRFQVKVRGRTITRYHYRAAAFSGVRSFSGVRTGGIRACSIFTCTDSSKMFCGRRLAIWVPESTVLFEELKITGTMPTPAIMPEVEVDDSFIFPVSLTASMMPLEVKDFTYNKNVTGNVTTHTMSLNNPDPELFTFGLWGRVFETDGQDVDPPVEEPPFEQPTLPDSPDAGWAHGLNCGLLVMILAILTCNH